MAEAVGIQGSTQRAVAEGTLIRGSLRSTVRKVGWSVFWIIVLVFGIIVTYDAIGGGEEETGKTTAERSRPVVDVTSPIFFGQGERFVTASFKKGVRRKVFIPRGKRCVHGNRPDILFVERWNTRFMVLYPSEDTEARFENLPGDSPTCKEARRHYEAELAGRRT